jgi:hypothetical protein
MRLADAVLRRGHLSEDALVEVWNTGIRPAHLDSCDICAERAIDAGRWLSDLQALGRADADAVFSDERLTAQRGSVLARLEQLDRPKKVISFPARKAPQADAAGGRRITPAWLGVAAAAGLMIGVVTVELSHLTPWGQQVPAPVVAENVTAPQGPTAADGERFLEATYDRPLVGSSYSTLDEMTPRAADFVLAVNR